MKRKSQLIISFLIFSTVLVYGQNFVNVENGNFKLGNEEFRFVGFNAYYLHDIYFEEDKRFAIEEVFQFAQAAGFKVIRTWAFDETELGSAILEKPYQLSEKGLEALDYILNLAVRYDTKLILTLANNHGDYGGIPKYLSWANENLAGGQNAFSHSDFFTHDSIKSWYKFYLSSILNRANSFTGIQYKNDPAIFSFELINEAVNHFSDPNIIKNWYSEMGGYFKSIDNNHLLGTGENGYDHHSPGYSDIDLFYNSADFLLNGMKGTSYIFNTDLENIDYATYHLYPSLWGMNHEAGFTWIRDHIKIAKATGKPALLGEFGIRNANLQIMNEFIDVLKSSRAKNLLVWNYRHPAINFRDGYEFNENDNPEFVALMKDYSLWLNTQTFETTPPASISLRQNYPNPFNPSTTIEYSLNETAYIKLELFNSIGERIGVLDEGLKEAGIYTLTLSFNSGFLSSGLYVYMLSSVEFIQSKKMMLLK